MSVGISIFTHEKLVSYDTGIYLFFLDLVISELLQSFQSLEDVFRYRDSQFRVTEIALICEI